MASLTKDQKGLWRIQWVEGTKRPALRLGRMSTKQAESILSHVEELLNARISGTTRPATLEWVKGLSDKMHKRLSDKGLVASRGTVHATVGELLDAAFDMLSVKPSTQVTYSQTRAALEKHFGEGRLLSTITDLPPSNRSAPRVVLSVPGPKEGAFRWATRASGTSPSRSFRCFVRRRLS